MTDAEVAPSRDAVPDLDPKIHLTPTSLEFTDDPTFEEWLDVGRQLQQMGRSWQWWWGDFLSYGEQKWKHRYSQVMEVMAGRETKTLQNAVWVADNIKPSRRREGLSFSHHAEAAASDFKDDLLTLAERGGWTVSGLRRVRREEKMLEDAGEDPAPVLEELDGAEPRRRGPDKKLVREHVRGMAGTYLEATCPGCFTGLVAMDDGELAPVMGRRGW